MLINIINISNKLPKGKPVKRKESIVRLFFHHSGADGKQGLQGVLNTVNYFMNVRGYDKRPYHYYLNYVPDKASDGSLIIYQLSDDSEICYSTGGCNNNSLGIVFQGNLSKKGPSQEQIVMFNYLTDLLVKKYNLSLPNGLSFHSEAGKFGGKPKPTCPGPFVEALVKEKRTVK
jgi:hypothetical protein